MTGTATLTDPHLGSSHMKQKDPGEYVEFYLSLIREGRVSEGVHGLLDAPPNALPALMEVLDSPENADIRPEMVHCIWQFRNPQAVDLLGRLIHDTDDEVWREALDGFVTIGGERSRTALQDALKTLSDADKREWVEEALSQIAAEP